MIRLLLYQKFGVSSEVSTAAFLRKAGTVTSARALTVFCSLPTHELQTSALSKNSEIQSDNVCLGARASPKICILQASNNGPSSLSLTVGRKQFNGLSPYHFLCHPLPVAHLGKDKRWETRPFRDFIKISWVFHCLDLDIIKMFLILLISRTHFLKHFGM